jgi:hypothetical protein
MRDLEIRSHMHLVNLVHMFTWLGSKARVTSRETWTNMERLVGS